MPDIAIHPEVLAGQRRIVRVVRVTPEKRDPRPSPGAGAIDLASCWTPLARRSCCTQIVLSVGG